MSKYLRYATFTCLNSMISFLLFTMNCNYLHSFTKFKYALFPPLAYLNHKKIRKGGNN